MYDVAFGRNSTFQLCHLELRTPVQLAPGTSCIVGAGLRVSSQEGSSVIWEMDSQSGTIKTHDNALCVHQRHGN